MKQKRHPHVFVSYSWDSDNHKIKVKEFVEHLRSDGVDVVYDGDFQLGTRLPELMENLIANSDVVLFICTPQYKYRADNRISGVGYESQLITGELYETYNETKFIPVLFTGSWEISLPTWAKGKLGVDLSTPEIYKANYQKLLLTLQSNPAQTKQHGVSNIQNTVENDEQQMLAQAELYYNGEQYKSVVELYTSKLLLENPVALNNLGYMYSKGIYFDQDFDTAVHYYELASNQGSSDAVHNLISIQLHSCATFEEVVNVLNKGYNSGDRGTFLFLGSILQGKELSSDPMTAQMRSSIVRDIESFFAANAEIQANILSASFGPRQSGPAFSSSVPQKSGSIYEEYILLGSNVIGRTHVYSYIKSPRNFRYDNLMQEHFASVIDSN